MMSSGKLPTGMDYWYGQISGLPVIHRVNSKDRLTGLLKANVFIKNVTSTILSIRNHPSLLVWTGGNEGHARKELYDVMRESIITLDGTRPFIPSSSGFAKLPAGWNGSWPDNLPSGVYSGGPYTWQDPEDIL